MHERIIRASVSNTLHRFCRGTMFALGFMAALLFCNPTTSVLADATATKDETVYLDTAASMGAGALQVGTEAEKPSVKAMPSQQTDVTDPQDGDPDKTTNGEGSTDDNAGSADNEDQTTGEEPGGNEGTDQNEGGSDGGEGGQTDGGEGGQTDGGEGGQTDGGEGGQTDGGEGGQTDGGEGGQTDGGEGGQTEDGKAPGTADPTEGDGLIEESEEAKRLENQAEKPVKEEKPKAESKKEEKRQEKLDELKKASEDTAVTQADPSGIPYQLEYRPIWRRELTPAERMRSSMQKILKQPVFAKVMTYLHIRSGPGLDQGVVGRLRPEAIAYLIDDEEDDAWAYVESGDVRGYVFKTYLIKGQKAAAIMEMNEEDEMPLADSVVAPEDNPAFTDFLFTVYDIPAKNYLRVARANAVIAYAEKFLGRPYVWGGTDLWNGSDCSGFMQTLFSTFGIPLPRTAHEQSLYLDGVAKEEAQPGDLLFFGDASGHVYHVAMYIGDGRMLHSQGPSNGVVISPIDLNSIYKIGRIFDEEGAYTSTQAITLAAIGRQAYEGNGAAKAEIIDSLAEASQKAYDEYGFAKSVLIAQVILESGWLSFAGSSRGGIEAEDNNVLGMNVELLNHLWESPWSGESVSRNVPQHVNGVDVYGYEAMRAYEDIESCMEDYAAFKIGLHPELRGVTDTDVVIDVGLEGYATDPSYKDKIRQIIAAYELTRFDEATWEPAA